MPQGHSVGITRLTNNPTDFANKGMVWTWVAQTSSADNTSKSLIDLVKALVEVNTDTDTLTFNGGHVDLTNSLTDLKN